MNILALDVSLTSTGIVTPDGAVTRYIPTTRGIERKHRIVARICDAMGEHVTDLAVIEAPVVSGRTNGDKTIELGKVYGAIEDLLFFSRCPVAWVPPASLKKFATGKGNADKGAMLAAAIRTLGYAGSSHDEADALWLWHMGHARYGTAKVDLTQYRVDALAGVAWPEVGE